jgi:hypothetical protein
MFEEFARAVALSVIAAHAVIIAFNVVCLTYCGFSLACLLSITVTMGAAPAVSVLQVEAVNQHFGMIDNTTASVTFYASCLVILLVANARHSTWLARRVSLVVAGCSFSTLVAGAVVYFRLEGDAATLNDSRVFLLQNLIPLFFVAVASAFLIFVPPKTPHANDPTPIPSPHTNTKRRCMAVTAKAGLVLVGLLELLFALVTLSSPSSAKEWFEASFVHRLDPLEALGFGAPVCLGTIFVGAVVGKLCLVVERVDVVKQADVIALLLPNIVMHASNMLAMVFVVGKSHGTDMHEPAMRVVTVATAFMCSAAAILLVSMIMLIGVAAHRETDNVDHAPPMSTVEMTVIGDIRDRRLSVSVSASAEGPTDVWSDGTETTTDTSSSASSFRPVPSALSNVRLDFSLSQSESEDDEL